MAKQLWLENEWPVTDVLGELSVVQGSLEIESSDCGSVAMTGLIGAVGAHPNECVAFEFVLDAAHVVEIRQFFNQV